MTRSRSRWKHVRTGSGSSATRRPREFFDSAAKGDRVAASRASSSSRIVCVVGMSLRITGRSDTGKLRLPYYSVATGARPLVLVYFFLLAVRRGRGGRLFAEHGLRRGEARDRNPKRRTRHIVQADLVAELDRCRVAAVLSADADLQILTRHAPALHGHAHHFADAVLIDDLEGVFAQDFALEVDGDERPLGVVSRITEDRLRQIIRAEREELGMLGDSVRHEARARQLDHRADLIVNLDAGFLEDPLR